jgi:hypothetical protein
MAKTLKNIKLIFTALRVVGKLFIYSMSIEHLGSGAWPTSGHRFKFLWRGWGATGQILLLPMIW